MNIDGHRRRIINAFLCPSDPYVGNGGSTSNNYDRRYGHDDRLDAPQPARPTASTGIGSIPNADVHRQHRAVRVQR